MDDILVGGDNQIAGHKAEQDEKPKESANNLKTKFTNLIKKGVEKQGEAPAAAENRRPAGRTSRPQTPKTGVNNSEDNAKYQYNRPNNRNNQVKKKSLDEYFSENPPIAAAPGVEAKPKNTTNGGGTPIEGQNAAKTENPRPQTPRTQTPRTQSPRPSRPQPRPQVSKPQAPKPQALKPNIAQNENLKSDAQKIEKTTNTEKGPAKKSSANGTKFNTKSNTRKNTGVKGASLAIIPLGGLGEIGKNMTAIKYGNNIIVIDGGMSFPDDELLGIDLVIPDYNYLLDNRSLVKGIFVTHGHEDHIGALPYLLRDLNVPVYGGKLALGLIKGKLKERRLNNVVTKEIQARDVIKMGPFEVEFIRVSHSIPDSFAIAVHTPVGVILHTGDFKLDMSPVDGQVMDLARIAALGEEGVLLLMADSTNVERPGFTASEKTVGKNLESVFFDAEGRIIVTTFASNVHRIQQAIWAAEKTGRRVAVVGRGMTNVIGIAQELGYLDVKRDTFIDIANINSLPDEKVVVITTGSQGETLAGLTRMSQDEHRQVHIRQGDVVVISANAIPGNEKTIAKTMDNLFRHGAEVVHGRDLGLHVSGHASEEDLKLIFNLVKPKYFFPVHGEYRMLFSHGKLAEKMGIASENIFILENGQVLEINQKTAAITGKVHSGRILIDGLGVGDVGTTVLKDRKQLSNDGIVIINLTMDKKVGRLIGDPYIISRGFVYEKDNDIIFSEAEQKVLKIIDANMGRDYNLNAIKSNIKNNLAKLFYDKTGRRPIVLPIVMEV